MLSPTFNINKIFASRKKADWDEKFRTIGFIENSRFFLHISKQENAIHAEFRVQFNSNTCKIIHAKAFDKTKNVKKKITEWVENEFKLSEGEWIKLNELGFASNDSFDNYCLDLGNWRIEVRRLKDESHVVETQRRMNGFPRGYWDTLKRTETDLEIAQAIAFHFKEDMDWDMFSKMNDKLRDLILKNEQDA